jgi:hypothetical protein
LFSAPAFIPGNARPIQNVGPQILGDLTSFRQELMYPYNLSDFTEITSAKPIHDQPLPFRLPFFGFSYHYVWVKFLSYFKFSIHIIISNDWLNHQKALESESLLFWVSIVINAFTPKIVGITKQKETSIL